MNKNGSAVFTVMCVILVVSLVVALMVRSGHQRIHTAHKMVDRVKALEYAEAGISQAYHTLSTNWEARLSDFPETEYAKGSYDVEIENVASNMIVIHSTGKCNKTKMSAAVLCKYYEDPLEICPEYMAWGKTIVAKGDLYFRGEGEVHGSGHADRRLVVSGGLDMGTGPIVLTSTVGIDIRGSVYTDGTLIAPEVVITGEDKIGIDVVESSVRPVSLPRLYLEKYYFEAEASGGVIAGGMFMDDVDWTGKSVVWVTGDADFKKDIVYDGIIIVTGDIKISGKATFSGTDGGKIISRDGGITIVGGCDIKGLLYSPGDVKIGGTITVKGSIMSGGSVDICGSIDVIDYERCAMDDIVGLDDLSGILVMQAWVE